MVPVPVAAITQANQVELSKLIELRQSQIRPLSHGVYMMNIWAVGDLCRTLVHTVIAPAFLFLEDPLAKLFPEGRVVEAVQISFGNQLQDPRCRP